MTTVVHFETEVRSTPLYTVRQASRYLDLPESTFRDWSTGYERASAGRTAVTGKAVLTRLQGPRGSRAPGIPFIGLAEGAVLAAFRRAGVPLQRIRPALEQLDVEMGVEHALASNGLFTDGAEVLFDHARRNDESGDDSTCELVVVRNGQRVFNDVVDSYLRRLEYGEDGYVSLLRLPAFEAAEVVVDPSRGFGQPIFARGGARIDDAIDMFLAGEALADVAEEDGVTTGDVEAVARVATRIAA